VSAAPAITIADPFSGHMEAVARKCLGDPNARLSSKSELRFGTNGSLSVDLEKGGWFDHEAQFGGGVMDLLAREKGLKGQEAIAWLRRECGAQFEDRTQTEALPPQKIVATYDYVDEHGEVLFQVCRMSPKTFRQRQPVAGGWVWNAKGVRPILYRLPELLEHIRARSIVFIVEGEKDADNLAREGICATCNPMGAGKWSEAYSDFLAGADVVILPDNDDAGQAHANTVAASLRGKAKRVRVLNLPDLPPKGDVSDWLNDGGDAAELLILATREARDWTPEAPKSRFGAVAWANMDSVRVDYTPLVKGLIYQGDTGMFYGDSGSGKSFLAVDMGLSIARGVPFLGMKTAKGAVLYQAGEGGKGLLKRLKAYRQEHQVTDALPFVLLPEKVNLFDRDGDVDALIEECTAWKAAFSDPLSLIVIDTFSAASTGANENASEDMGRMLDAGHRLNKATGAAVVWVHHKNAGGLRERGHTSFRANIETVVEVIKDPETKERTLHLVKLKDGEDGLKLGFELQSVTLGSDDDGDPITSCVVRPAQLGTEQTSHRRPLPRGQQRFLKTLDTAISQYGGMIPGIGRYGVAYSTFRDLFVASCGQGMTPVAVRQTLSRDGNDLWLDDLIGREETWLWITDKGGIYL
jgi:hypothetical protein